MEYIWAVLVVLIRCSRCGSVAEHSGSRPAVRRTISSKGRPHAHEYNFPSSINRRRERRRVRRGAPRWRKLALGFAISAFAVGAVAGPALAASTPPDISGNYTFKTINDKKDLTFNQLLGINNSGLIAGYFGSGATGHPNNGYTVGSPYGQGNFKNENFPGSVQTQVTGLNNNGVTVGFWVDAKGANNGFYNSHGQFHTVNFPTSSNASPRVDQLLGVNDQGIAVGFYTDATGNNHGFSYNISTRRFHTINVSGDTKVTVAAINNENDVTGFATNSAGNTEAFLLRSDGKLYRLNFPGSASTQAFGLNDGDEVVGAYTVGAGSTATTTGFVWAPGFGFQTVNDPNGVGATTINGVNDRGTLVGFYTDSAGNTDGLLAKSTLGL